MDIHRKRIYMYTSRFYIDIKKKTVSRRSPAAARCRRASLKVPGNFLQDAADPRLGGLAKDVRHGETSGSTVQVIQDVESTAGGTIGLYLHVVVQTQMRVAIDEVSETLVVLLRQFSETVVELASIHADEPVSDPVRSRLLDGIRVAHVS
jgi:hypothetical protein